MIDLNTIINTCYQTQNTLQAIVHYSHLIPLALSLILGTFILIKAKFNFFSKIFFAFIATFSVWLIGNFITWSSLNYHLVYATWSFLLYIEIVFYVVGLYFVMVFVKKTDIPNIYKIILFIATLLPLIYTVFQKSVTGFYHPACEAFNSGTLDTYKLVVELFILSVILAYALSPFFKKLTWRQKMGDWVVFGSMFVFLPTFAITEYVGATTGNYEINLYSLFLLPLFLIAIIYSVFALDIFNVRILGTHYIVVGLIVLIGGQLFFVTSETDKWLTVLTIILLAGLSVILFKNLKKESDQRVYIEKLNFQLKDLIKQRESLVHLVTHKVKGSFTRSKYIFAGVLDGTFGDVSAEIKKRAEQGLESDNAGIKTVDLILNVANIQNGTVRYDMKMLNFKELVAQIIAEKKVQAEAKGLTLESTIEEVGVYTIVGDAFWFKEAINNLIDNAIKYTKEGKITVDLHDGGGKIRLSVRDTGVGITEEDKQHLFTEGGRGKDSVRINVDSTGYGLYSVKLIIEAHKGKVWAESEGPGKGSQFYIELDATA